MLPFYAQGAAQAIEDASTLAALLADVSSDEIPARLELYSSLRYPRVRRVQKIAYHYAVENHHPDGPEQELRDARLADPANNAFAASGWLYAHDAEAAAKEALRSLEPAS
jgi:salicylate hydroxylase